MAYCPVKWFHSNMGGAPQLSDTFGCLTTMLDAVLVNGFNTKTVGAITCIDGVATATVPSGVAYAAGSVVIVQGAEQPEYNGEQRVISANPLSFTFAVTGSPPPATTLTIITVKTAPLGFDIAFSGTNKRAYRSKNVLSNRPYLRVDDGQDPVWTSTYAKKGKVTMAEEMTGIDTFSAGKGRAPFTSTTPSINESGSGSGSTAVDGWYKWYYARQEANGRDHITPAAMNRNWVIIGDDRGFYFFTLHDGSFGRAGYSFTDFASFKESDRYNTILTATEWYRQADTHPSNVSGDGYQGADFFSRFARTNDPSGRAIMKDFTQTGGWTRALFVSLATLSGQTVSGYSTGVPWPNGPDGSLLLHKVYLQQETGGHIRGIMPGLMWVHNNSPHGDLTMIDNVAGYPGRKFMMVDCAHSGASNSIFTARVAFDITGPWW